MLEKYTVPFVLLCSALVMGCGDSGSGSSNGGSGGQGGSGGSTATAGSSTGGSGGSTATGGTGGVTTTSTTEGTTTSAGCQPLGDACTACLADKCNMTYCSCFADPSCGALVQCSQGCAGDANCNQTCLTNNENGISEAALLSDCGAKNCPECPGTAALGDCELCAFSMCEQQINKCFANPDCAALVACVQGGGDPFTCAGEYPGGYTDASDLNDCTQANCAGSGC